jgi:hypothetical protein
MQRINEDLLRKQCADQHGPVMGAIIFRHRLDDIKVQTSAYEELQRKREAVVAELAAVEDATPSLEPLQADMDRAYAEWMKACAALEEQRAKNAAAGSELRTKIGEIDKILADTSYPARIEPWTKLATPEAPYVEPLVNQVRAQSQQRH